MGRREGIGCFVSTEHRSLGTLSKFSDDLQVFVSWFGDVS